MKAMVASPVGRRVSSTTRRVFITRGRKNLEAEGVAAYFGKLRDLVPHMPRKRKLSKLEVIQRVIQYIYELESTLEEHNKHDHQKEENIDHQQQENDNQSQLTDNENPLKQR
ncbi:PREDICTED: DNA-binding protein inhibitor ID-2-A [Ceratosolen solmsi marchali]|uniref:DNA-binding protein inhibitor ID-2-A n=1 Tax=Ceratosolen solmsi marchali TaxID=326594 RepID=A0AAJ6YDD8_9HYME|nr:PREDICTED: DNA-binding protein inhibitor ID-2-A [Ceratosolen solmsi marchali]